MEWNWHIALNVLWLIIVAGFAVWLGILSFKNSEARGFLIVRWVITAVIVYKLWRNVGPMIVEGGGQTIGGMLIATALLFALAALWRGSLIDVCVKPLTGMFDGGSEPPE